MMLIHESGHMLGAIFTGGQVERLIWHPLVFSRTDVSPNPSPLIVVWAGPLFGAVAPAILAACLSAAKAPVAYLAQFFAGFCLIANGGYIGVGTFERVGDAKDMLRLGTQPWLMVAFGVLAIVAGFWIWNRISPKLGFGRNPKKISTVHAYAMLLVAIGFWSLAFTVGNRGE
jgi:uncharacterized membrane protein YidH (DUF202 family)